MKHVTILGLTDTSATIIAGPLDIFHFAGRLWNHIFGEPQTPYFTVEIVSTDGAPIRCLGNMSIQAHRVMTEIDRTDLLLIPSIKDIDETMAAQPAERTKRDGLPLFVERAARMAAMALVGEPERLGGVRPERGPDRAELPQLRLDLSAGRLEPRSIGLLLGGLGLR